MEPKNTPQPAQPHPADTTLPAKGTPDAQQANDAQPTNLPRPASTPDAEKAPAAAPTVDAETSESEAADEQPVDPAVDVQPDTSGDTDPGASRNDDAHPL